MGDKKLVVIDGYSFLFRAYHSMPSLTRPSDGTPVGAIYGFISMVMKVLSDMKPSHIVMVFDAGKKTFRHDLYAEYKANRPPPPEDLVPQFALVREAARALNLDILEKVGFEADDIIATLSKMAKHNEEEVLIVSSDKDLMQLVNSHVKMYDAIKSREVGEKEVEEKYGVKPGKIRDLLALVGDSSDNVPGVPGIGPKTAAELLNRFDDIEGIYEHIEEITQKKRKESLQENRELVKLSRELVSLKSDMELGVEFSHLKSKAIDSKVLLDFLHAQNFRTLVSRAKNIFGIEDTKEMSGKKDDFNSSNIQLIKKDLSEIIKKAEYYGEISIYLQPNFKYRESIKNIRDVHSVSITVEERCHYYIPISEDKIQGSLLEEKSTDCFTFKELFLELNGILSDISVKKILWNYKMVRHLIDEVGCDISSCEDIMLMAYDLGSGRTNTNFIEMIEFFLEEHDDVQVSGLTKARNNLESLDERKIKQYVTKNSYFIRKIYQELLAKSLEGGSQSYYRRIDLPLAEVVFKMERAGIKVRKEVLIDLEKQIDKEITKLSSDIYNLSDEEFNIASSQQVADVLFNKMGIVPQKKSKKSGGFSTNLETLEQLQADGHAIADLLIEWRKLTKMKSTYTSTLVSHVESGHSKDRIHSTFSLALTSTGRFSSLDPNLQNIPVRGRFADEIRSAFVAKDGHKILALDYSQIELRILAEIANVKSLKKAFKEGVDIHTMTASEIFGVGLDDVTKDLRSKAKAINFGIIYGISAHGLSKNIKIPRDEAKKYIEKYFERYPEILVFMEKSKEFSRENEYVETIMNRKCYVKNINSKDHLLRSFAERAAINFPIQGSSSDIMRRAMVLVSQIITKEKLSCRIILQIHDELLFEVRDQEVESVSNILKTQKKNTIDVSVPLLVNVSVGDTWKKL